MGVNTPQGGGQLAAPRLSSRHADKPHDMTTELIIEVPACKGEGRLPSHQVLSRLVFQNARIYNEIRHLSIK